MIMTYEWWVTTGLFIAAVLFLTNDVPAKPPKDRNVKSKRQA
jgi:hypothetical protein